MRRIAPGLGGFADSLTVRTLGSALQQGLHLWLRHWSPAVMVGLIRSVRIRRVTFALAVADAIARPSAPGSLRDAPVRLISRAITRTAYGVGVWRGALRRRTLLPIVPIVGDRAKDH